MQSRVAIAPLVLSALDSGFIRNIFTVVRQIASFFPPQGPVITPGGRPILAQNVQIAFDGEIAQTYDPYHGSSVDRSPSHLG